MDSVERIRKELSEFHYIKYSFCDINGNSQGKILPVHQNAAHFEKDLFIYCGSLMFGQKGELVYPKAVADSGGTSMAIIPDLDTLHTLPWAGNGKFKIAEFYCETAWMPGLKPQEACPRYIAKQQCEKLNGLGYDLFSGFEKEFYLRNRHTKKPVFECPEYCMSKTLRSCEFFLLELDDQMLKSGVEIFEFHTESGPGMIEYVIKPQWGIKCPDMTFGFVQGVFEVSQQHHLIPTFISKQNAADNGIGSHFSHSLWENETKTNAFYDPTKPDNVSDIAKYWIGGLIMHSGALTALCSPTANCYRRLYTPWAPGTCFWDIDNRNAAFRFKNNESGGTYCENRIPSGKCNPYLVFAATVAAGIDGIVKKIKCPPTRDPSAPDLPVSLSFALDALKNDDVMVSALSQEFVDWFIQLKIETEIKPLEEETDNQRWLLEANMYQ